MSTQEWINADGALQYEEHKYLFSSKNMACMHALSRQDFSLGG